MREAEQVTHLVKGAPRDVGITEGHAALALRRDGDAAAQVVIVWTPLLNGNRIGLTRIEAVNDTIRTGRITVATQREGGVALRDADIARCALHEVGHLLGLTHTIDLASIMAPESSQPTLSPRDRATVQLLYALPIGSLKAGATR